MPTATMDELVSHLLISTIDTLRGRVAQAAGSVTSGAPDFAVAALQWPGVVTSPSGGGLNIRTTVNRHNFEGTTMLLSFLVCVHKDHEFLDASLQSTLDQDYENDYKIYVVANNCSDAFWEKISKYSNDNEKIVAHRTDIGQLCFNLNFGANLVQSQYIVRMDGDDICLPSRLRDTHETIVNTDYPDVLVGQCLIIDHMGKTIGQSKLRSVSSIRNNLPFRNTITHPAVALKRSTLLADRGYSGGFVSEDVDLWIRFFRNDRRFVVMTESVIKYRQHIEQGAGSQLAYAEYASYLLREFLLTGSPRMFFGFLFSSAKTLIRATQKW